MNFDLFCKKTQKKCKTAITFVYDVEKKFNISKKTREKLELDFTRVYPVKFSQILKIPKGKKVISNQKIIIFKILKINLKKIKNTK